MFKEKTTTLETLPNIITTQTPHKVYYKIMAGKKAHQVDELVKEGSKEYKAGKTRRISSLAELR